MEYSVLERLPNNEQRCLCFGYKTFCCKEDMDDDPEWHEVTFIFHIWTYKLKKEFPEDIEESVLEKSEIKEDWKIGNEFTEKESSDGEFKRFEAKILAALGNK